MRAPGPRPGLAGAALLEFALVWPVALLLVLGCVELSLWATEAYSARAAALAGARAGTVVGANPSSTAQVALRALGPSLVGGSAAAWCPGQSASPPQVWVCVRDLGTSVTVTIGGAAPSLVPLFGGSGLPLHADVTLQKESFSL
ncbi:MAG TPA: TadE family protein [Patescibacteria group bacterium]|nr:TadE family protein [Patescibacteria group bacterium]